MHNEIFQFQDFFFEIFHDILNFHIKSLKTVKNMIKVYEISRKYIMLFMHNNRYLPLTGLLTLLQWTIQSALIVHREIFEIFQRYFTKYFMKYFMKYARLPNSMCQLAKVTFIDVSENVLKKLPNCLNKNEALVELRASNNKIKKPPPKLADAPKILKVWLTARVLTTC